MIDLNEIGKQMIAAAKYENKLKNLLSKVRYRYNIAKKKSIEQDIVITLLLEKVDYLETQLLEKDEKQKETEIMLEKEQANHSLTKLEVIVEKDKVTKLTDSLINSNNENANVKKELAETQSNYESLSHSYRFVRQENIKLGKHNKSLIEKNVKLANGNKIEKLGNKGAVDCCKVFERLGDNIKCSDIIDLHKKHNVNIPTVLSVYKRNTYTAISKRYKWDINADIRDMG